MAASGSRLKMVVCMDGSEFSDAVLPGALAVAVASNAEVHMLGVLDPDAGHEHKGGARGGLAWADVRTPRSIAPDQAGRRGGSVETKSEAQDRLRNAAGSHLRSHMKGFPEDAREVVLLASDPAKAIIEYAQEQQADLIAMASHARGAVRELLAGSVTDAVVRSGVAPVLVVHTKKK